MWFRSMRSSCKIWQSMGDFKSWIVAIILLIYLSNENITLSFSNSVLFDSRQRQLLTHYFHVTNSHDKGYFGHIADKIIYYINQL